MEQDPEVPCARGIIAMEDADLPDPPRCQASRAVILCVCKEVLDICHPDVSGDSSLRTQVMLKYSTVSAIVPLFQAHGSMSRIRSPWLVAERND